ncbi:MAG: insulinase family protein [Halobacteriovoraceae bacterium]|jgi:zinc protease|nr:insulinase family protein [Halobacteriovoraceae bacterium]MBT5092602.1 insulinase family protein [Halobacteriovoraceae bacterium]
MLKKLKLLLLSCFLVSLPAQAKLGIDSIVKLDWNGLEVVWLQDERFPTYNMQIYFGDGALSDPKGKKGLSSAVMSLLDAGTRRYDQKAIAENLEFFGAQYGGDSNHEYSSFTIAGLVKDRTPTIKMICHLFKDASFPKKEIKKARVRAVNGLKNMINSHGQLASRAFRELSLKGTPFSYPASGKIKDLGRIRQKDLKKKLDYLNKKVSKRIYITSPKEFLDIKHIVNEECGWKDQKGLYTRTTDYQPRKNKNSPKIVLVTVPKANQAQVRVGKFLNKGDFSNPALLKLLSEYLGGGFTSKLFQEIRVKRGLSYSAWAYAAGQKDYGRSGIGTFTKNKTLIELLEVIEKTLGEVAGGKIENKEVERAKGSLAGSYPFQFELNAAFLGQLLYLDHVGRSYSEVFEFPKQVSNLGKENLVNAAKSIFDWNAQTIVIVGPKKLLKVLKKKFPRVEMKSYKNFL